MKASPGGLGKSRPSKRLQGTQIGKEDKGRRTEGRAGRKLSMMEKWLLMEKEESEDSPRPSRRKDKA